MSKKTTRLYEERITTTTAVGFALSPPPPPRERKEMTASQAASMTGLCYVEAKRDTGYDPVPIEVLRDDKGILELLDMLETCRPCMSPSEEGFIDRFIRPLVTHEDNYGNLMVQVPIPEGHPRIMWSCHTDTVHWHGGTQTVEVSSGIAWTRDGSCLGADDTVGVWLALQMIRAQVPGVYVFHREEESGGLGSRWLAREHKDWIGSFDAAIALDRADYADVITHQAGGRCCSDAFAKSVAALLGGNFKPCDRGVFTDTANYTDLIGECTNLSVGYFKQHGPMEHTNLGFAFRLRNALLAADWSKLVLERQPGEDDDLYAEWESRWDDGRYGGGGGRAYGSVGSARSVQIEALEEFVREFPWVVAEYLFEAGITVDDLDLFEPEEGR